MLPPHAFAEPAPGAEARSRCERRSRGGDARGFTLIELVVVIIILGVLATIAVPRYLELGRAARVAAVQMMSGAVWEAASNAHMACLLNPACDQDNGGSYLVLSGTPTIMAFGWPDAGDYIGNAQIDVWVIHTGFTISLYGPLDTNFNLDGAPDPNNCVVVYSQSRNPGTLPGIHTVTTGC